jgi:hypothetical protein
LRYMVWYDDCSMELQGRCKMKTQKKTTLRDLVQTVGQFAKDDTEIVTVVAHLINSGRVQFCGNFAGAKISYASPFDVFPEWARPRSRPTPPRRPALAA